MELGKRVNKATDTVSLEFPNDEIALAALGTGQYIFCQGDVHSSDDIETALETVGAQKGYKFKLAVNCVGYAERARLFSQKTEMVLEFEYIKMMLENNVVGAFNFSRLCAQAMAKNDISKNDEERGVIINTSGIHAKCGSEYHSATSATQGAISAMTLPMSRDLAHCNIRVNAISPGYFKTNLVFRPHYQITPKLENFIGLLNAFPTRIGQPEEFAQLVTDIYDNKMLNGEVLDLNAGCRLPP